MPYATAKAAIEGLTRALAVNYGPSGIRVNAVALGSIATQRYLTFLASQELGAAARAQEQMRALHPLGRAGPSRGSRSGCQLSALGAGKLHQRRHPARRRRAVRARPRSRAGMRSTTCKATGRH